MRNVHPAPLGSQPLELRPRVERAPEHLWESIVAQYQVEPLDGPVWDDEPWVDGDGEPLPAEDPEAPDDVVFVIGLDDDLGQYFVEVA